MAPPFTVRRVTGAVRGTRVVSSSACEARGFSGRSSACVARPSRRSRLPTDRGALSRLSWALTGTGALRRRMSATVSTVADDRDPPADAN